MLHGREESLRALRDGLTRAREGRGGLVLLSGEAGIGKSALAEALAVEATGTGATVTTGRAWEFAEAPAYFPVWPCMRSLGLATGELDSAPAFELWEHVLATLAQHAHNRTLVWLVEDIHAADLGTLDLLTYLAQPVRALRVLIVVTLRMHDPRLTERKLQRIARMARDGTELRLGALDERAIAALAEEQLGRPLPAPALQHLVEMTGGNALFVVEYARASRSSENAFAELPPTIRQLVLERVALLPEATRTLLEAGAVLGREMPAAIVARMMNVPAPAVIDALLPALRAGVLRESRAAHFVFSHVLVRDAIEAAIGAEARAKLHAAAEAALADVGDEVEVLVERARHALAAAHAGRGAHARELAMRAAAILERDGAYDRACALYARVDEIRAAGLLAAATPTEKLHVARVARDAGRIDLMQRYCEDVIAVARATTDFELLGAAAMLHATIIRPGVIDPFQVVLLEEACNGLPADSPLRCRVLARLAPALQPADDTARPNALAREALAAARATGDDALILDVLDLAALGLWGAPLAERIAWSEELRDRAIAADDVPKALEAWGLLGMWYVEQDELAKVSVVCTQLLALADRAPPRCRWEALLFASSWACATGNFAEAQGYITDVAQIAALVDDPALSVSLVLHELMRARLRRRADELEAPLARLDEALRDLKRGPIMAMILRASCHARLGDLEATRAELAKLGTAARVFESDYSTVAYLAEPYALAGSDADRRWAHACLAKTSELYLYDGGFSFASEGPTERLLGLLEASLGDLESAERKLARAHAHAIEHGLRPWIAQIGFELADVRAKLGMSSRALLEDSVALGRELGMGFGAVARSSTATLLVHREGDVWTIERDTAIARVKDSRGMQLLARLLERPNEELHVLALASDEGTSAPESNAGEMIDERARKAYKKRVTELAAAIEAARGRGDTKAVARLDSERIAIVRELSRATGIGGRTRMAGSETERARVNVQRRLKEAIQRITDANPSLGTYLDTSVRTGTFCCFAPVARVPESGTPRG